MRLLRIQRNNELKKDIYTNRLSDTMLLNFAFVDTETKNNEKGEKYKYQTTKFVTCRELICSFIQHNINDLDYCGYDYKVDHDTLRIIFATDEATYNKSEAKTKLFVAKRIINIMEDYMGLPYSIMASVKHVDMKDKIGCWLFTGHGDWIHAPQLISLLLLIFRFCFYHEKFSETIFDDDINLDTLIIKFKDYIVKFIKDSLTENKMFQAKKDAEYMNIVLPHLKPLLKNYKQVFEGKTEQYYPLNKTEGFNGYGGIDTLFKKETGNPALNKRFQHHVLNCKINV